MMESPCQKNREKPSLLSALLSPTAVSNLVSSACLVACLLLPHSVGCNDTIIRPVDLVLNDISEQSSVFTTFFAWPYLFAFFTVLTFIAIVIVRPRRIDRILFALPLITAAYLIILGAIWTSFEGIDTATGVFASVLLPFILISIRVIWLVRRGQVLTAAAWGQSFLCILMIFSLRWWWFPPVKKMLFGGIVSMLAAAAMMVASWMWDRRAIADLSDQNTEPQPLQFTVFQLVSATTFVAMSIALWRWLAE